jgi:hypothetical protein
VIHRHAPNEPCNASCSDPKPLVTAVSDLAHSAVSLGNHLLRLPVTPVSDWSDRLAYAAREFARLEKEARAFSDDARAMERRLA